MSKDLIIFDFDGTLVNTTPGITNSISYILNKHQLSSSVSLDKWVGPPIEESFMKFCGVSKEEAIGLSQEFRIYYNDKEIFNCELFPDIIELLWQLKLNHKFIAIASGKRTYMIQEILKHFHINMFFDYIAGMTDEFPDKTKADLIQDCLNHFKVSKENALMIGDTEIDAKGAYLSNVDFIGVTWGIDYSKNKYSKYKAEFINKPLEVLNYD